MRGKTKPCGTRPHKERIHVVNKIEKTVRMEKTIEDSKRCNILAVRKRLKTVSQRRGVDNRNKKLFIPPYLIRLCLIRCVLLEEEYFIHG